MDFLELASLVSPCTFILDYVLLYVNNILVHPHDLIRHTKPLESFLCKKEDANMGEFIFDS